jgi:hypothetical protein
MGQSRGAGDAVADKGEGADLLAGEREGAVLYGLGEAIQGFGSNDVSRSDDMGWGEVGEMGRVKGMGEWEMG